jgi:putative glutamine amidotransferase
LPKTVPSKRSGSPTRRGFALGVQWHAEYDPQRNPINRALFEAFGDALKAQRRAS